MTIQDLGSIGELIAAIATLATLIYLAAQIRQNTNAMKTSAVSSLHDVQLLTRDNDHYNVLVIKSLRSEELTVEERLHMVERFFTIIRAFEGVWVQQQLGAVTRDQFREHLDLLRWPMSHPAARRMWAQLAPTFASLDPSWVDPDDRGEAR